MTSNTQSRSARDPASSGRPVRSHAASICACTSAARGPVYVPVGLVAGLGDVALPHVQSHRLSLGTVALYRRDHGVEVVRRPIDAP
jgi:hypothetical protein